MFTCLPSSPSQLPIMASEFLLLMVFLEKTW
jgi:hypothetical protein